MGLRVENPVPIFPVSTPPPSRRHTPPYDHPGSPAPFPWHPIKTQWAFQWVRGNISGNPWRRRSPQSRVVAHVRLGPYDAVARCGHPCGTPSPAHLFLCSPVPTAGWGIPVRWRGCIAAPSTRHWHYCGFMFADQAVFSQFCGMRSVPVGSGRVSENSAPTR